MENKKRCIQCRELIEPKDHQVCLVTKNDGEIMEKAHFHINCWSKYFNKAVTNKAKTNVSKMQTKVKGLMDNPMLKGVLGSVGGSEKLMGMLGTDLIEEDMDATMEKLGIKQKNKSSKKYSKKSSNKKSVNKKKNGNSKENKSKS